MRAVLIALAALVLTGCAAPGTASITYGDAENPTRVTAVSGLDSRDAAHAVGQSAYYDAKVRKPLQKACEIKALPGQSITGVSEITCYSPGSASDEVAAPERLPTAFAENITAVGNATAKVIDSATPVVGIIEGAKLVKGLNESAAKAPEIVRPEIVRPEIVNPVIVSP